MFEKGGWQMLLMMSEYKTASPEVNRQCSEITQVISRYDSRCMLVGEAACTKDLIEITNHDFNTVNWVSIGVIAVIILFVFRSVSLPVILVAAIEFVIFINMGIPYYTGTTHPFIARSLSVRSRWAQPSITRILDDDTCTGRNGRPEKIEKNRSVLVHSTSIASILVSAFSFFAATFGVGLYSEIDMISSLLHAYGTRGADLHGHCHIHTAGSAVRLPDLVILYGIPRVQSRKKQKGISGTAVRFRGMWFIREGIYDVRNKR